MNKLQNKYSSIRERLYQIDKIHLKYIIYTPLIVLDIISMGKLWYGLVAIFSFLKSINIQKNSKCMLTDAPELKYIYFNSFVKFLIKAVLHNIWSSINYVL